MINIILHVLLVLYIVCVLFSLFYSCTIMASVPQIFMCSLIYVVYYYYYLLYKSAFQLFCSDKKTEQLDTLIGLPRKESISL